MCVCTGEALSGLFESVMAPFSPSVFHSDAEFREPRVIELWEAAKRANLSEDELDSLKVIPQIAPHSQQNLCFHTFVTRSAIASR